MGVKGRADYYEHGSWNVACSMCGRKRKASDVVRNWQGLYRCPEHDEPRQPQDYVRNVKDDTSVPFAQPETDSYILVCTFNGSSAIPWYAIPGCSIPGRATLIDAGEQYVPFVYLQDDKGNYIRDSNGNLIKVGP